MEAWVYELFTNGASPNFSFSQLSDHINIHIADLID